MAYSLTYKDKTFFLMHTGVISINEINEANGIIHGHEEFYSHRYQIVDLLDSDFSEIYLTKAKQPGAIDSAASKIKSNVKVALIVKEKKAKEFCKEYISTANRLGSRWKFELFADISSASKWLKI